MKDKKKFIICAAVAVVVVAGIIVGIFIGKRKADKNTDIENSIISTTTTTTTTTAVTEEEGTEPSTEKITTTTPEFSHKIPVATGEAKFGGGVARGICTYKGVDYVATEDGLFAVTASGKKKLTSQKADNYLSIIDDKIYYSVESKTEKEYIDGFETTINWQLYEGWVMNLDGSGQKKLVDFIGDGFIIYADDNAIYYAESPGPGIYTCGIGYNINKYDINTGKKTLIDDGTVVHVDEDGEKEVWKESVDNILYYDGCIYFRHYTYDGSYVRAAKYDIKTGKKTDITDVCQQLYLAKNGTIYMIVGEETNPRDTRYEYDDRLASYSPESNKINIIKKYNYCGVEIFDSDADNVYVNCSDYNSEKTVIAYYNNKDGYKEFWSKNEWLDKVCKCDSETGKLIYIDDQENKTLLKELNNGKEKVVKELKDYGGYLAAAGEHCMLIDIYISEESDTENDFYKEEIIMLK